jgi:hypothetical protein
LPDAPSGSSQSCGVLAKAAIQQLGTDTAKTPDKATLQDIQQKIQ